MTSNKYRTQYGRAERFNSSLVKGAEEAWGIGLIGQRLHSRTRPSHSFQDGVIHVVKDNDDPITSDDQKTSNVVSN